MSFKKTFCPSPWFHMRINNAGSYRYCRWQQATADVPEHNLRYITPSEYFKTTMSGVRKDLLDGKPVPECSSCYKMEQHGKVSGRQRQLLKVGIMPDHFDQSLASSTYRNEFDYSASANGAVTTHVQDWQIDLGNYCNSQCVMCNPASSSKLATEFKSLGLIESMPPRAWCDDPALLDKFCNDLATAPSIQYLHFIGGETLITPGFKKILSTLVNRGLAQNITVGFTTNLTVWDDAVFDLLTKFKNVNLGLSIEAIDPINDYIRFPSKLTTVCNLLDRWVTRGNELGWFLQLRITPTCLSMHKLYTVYDYAYKNNLSVESCNFIDNPASLRISVLPMAIRIDIASQLQSWIAAHPVTSDTVINTRNPNFARAQIVQDAQSYVDYLTDAPDESKLLPDLIAYLTKLESSRRNSIIDYLPNYEQLFRANGYTPNT